MKMMKKQGFTLIEIMLVVIIISILAAMVVPNLAGRGKQARLTAARVDIETNITSALDLYELDNGVYPTTEQGLKALIVKPTSGAEMQNWNGPYMKNKKMPIDPWGRAYVYTCPGAHNPESFDLMSYGQDGIQSSDDIGNWGKENLNE
jgi:general secretion pathway protein G